ncbi:hypothetical protein JHK87_004806 [Glycine soja]|nr:hypothetical protein JHK87_004806 [Glycine soja]
MDKEEEDIAHKTLTSAVQPPASNKLNEKDEKRELLLESIRKAMEGLTIVGTAMMVFL